MIYQVYIQVHDKVELVVEEELKHLMEAVELHDENQNNQYLKKIYSFFFCFYKN
jgi:hypothetical protein